MFTFGRRAEVHASDTTESGVESREFSELAEVLAEFRQAAEFLLAQAETKEERVAILQSLGRAGEKFKELAIGVSSVEETTSLACLFDLAMGKLKKIAPEKFSLLVEVLVNGKYTNLLKLLRKS